MKSFKNFAYFLFILLFLSCSSQITDATKTDFSVSIDFSSIIESQKQNISRSVTNQNGSIKFKLYDVTNLRLSQNEKFEDVENFFQQDNIEPLFQEETVIVNQKAQVQFKEVDVGIKALILVECAINNADYNGKSNIFEIKAGENPVTITLSKVVVADPDPDPEPSLIQILNQNLIQNQNLNQNLNQSLIQILNQNLIQNQNLNQSLIQNLNSRLH